MINKKARFVLVRWVKMEKNLQRMVGAEGEKVTKQGRLLSPKGREIKWHLST